MAEHSARYTTHPRLREARWWSKLIPFCIVIPTTISLIIGSLLLRHYKDSGALYQWSVSSRALVQVIIHILSSLLSILWVYPVCTIISHWTRHRLSQKDINLDTLRLWSAVTLGRTDWNLPWGFALVTLGFLTLMYLPATLWAGALTPSLTHKMLYGVSLPIPGSGPHGNYSFLHPPAIDSAFADCWSLQQPNGTFTNCPQKFNTGNLLRTVATASSLDGAPRNHSKWDNTKFQYIGRSFGVGAAAGLTDHHITVIDNVQQYTYHEPGFVTETKCIYNESSALEIIPGPNHTDTGTYPNLYRAQGALPNSNWTLIHETNGEKGFDFYAQVALKKDSGVVSTFNRGPINDDIRYMFGIAAGSSYAQLDKIQCQITFEPSDFVIEVSISNSTINVSRNKEAAVKDPDPTGSLRSRAMSSYGLSFVVSSLYVSTVGDAFMENIRNLQIRQSLSPDAEASNTTVLDAVADSVIAIMDDTLVALGAAALTFPNATQAADVVISIAAVQIGSGPFILAAVIINLIGLLGVLAGYCVLRKVNIPIFDYNDLGCMAVGVTHAAVTAARDGRKLEDVQSWNGDPRSRSIGRLSAKLEVSSSSGRPAVSLK